METMETMELCCTCCVVFWQRDGVLLDNRIIHIHTHLHLLPLRLPLPTTTLSIKQFSTLLRTSSDHPSSAGPPVVSPVASSDLRSTGSPRSAQQRHIAAGVAEFATNGKAQLATEALCTVVRRHGSSLRNSWNGFVHCLVELRDMRLLPSTLLSETTDDYLPEQAKARLVALLRRSNQQR